MPESLPDIAFTNRGNVQNNSSGTYGALSVTVTYEGAVNIYQRGGYREADLSFSASKYSSVYKAGAHVRPNSYHCTYFIRY